MEVSICFIFRSYRKKMLVVFAFLVCHYGINAIPVGESAGLLFPLMPYCLLSILLLWSKMTNELFI